MLLSCTHLLSEIYGLISNIHKLKNNTFTTKTLHNVYEFMWNVILGSATLV